MITPKMSSRCMQRHLALYCVQTSLHASQEELPKENLSSKADLDSVAQDIFLENVLLFKFDDSHIVEHYS